jgi:acyl-CoA thioesterase I
MSALLLLKIIAIGLVALALILVISLAELSTQLVRYRNYWQKNNERPPQSGELVYVALGDSAAQGVGASSPRKGYVGLIAKELESTTGRPVRVINFSKSGASIRDVIDAQMSSYQALDLKDKHVLTIDIGANDIIRLDKSKFEKDMNELMSKMPKHAVMSDMPSLLGSRFAKHEDGVRQANKITERLAKKHSRQLAKLNDRTQQNHSLKVFGADFFHPSNYGYKINWLPAFMERIRESSQA